MKRHAGFGVALLLGAAAGCQDPRGDNWQEVKALQARVAQLERELEECRQGPGKLLRSAQGAYDKGEYALAIAEARNLLAWHPRAAEVAAAEALVRDAEAALAAAETARQQAAAREAGEAAVARERALARMKASADKAQGVTWYRHVDEPAYLNARSVLSPYVVVDRAGNAHLMLRNVWVGKRALGIGGYQVGVDGREFSFSERFRQESDSVSAWEWIEGQAATPQREMLAAIAQGRQVTITYRGSAGSEQRRVGQAEQAMIGEVLAAYEVLLVQP